MVSLTRSALALLLVLIPAAAAHQVLHPDRGASRFVTAPAEGGQEVQKGPDRKPWVDPALDVEAALEAALKGAHVSRVSQWAPGTIPESCLRYFARDGGGGGEVRIGDFAVYNVTYDDCDRPWVFCRHRDAGKSIEEMTQVFGKLPVGMREGVRALAALPPPPPGEDSWVAYSVDDDIVVRPCCWTVRVLAHEAAHVLDSRGLPAAASTSNDNNNNSPRERRRRRFGWPQPPRPDKVNIKTIQQQQQRQRYSETARWRGADARDELVVTPYALVSWAEHFAEMAAPGLLEAAGGRGAVGRLRPDAGRGLAGQMQTWTEDWGFLVREGARCKPGARREGMGVEVVRVG